MSFIRAFWASCMLLLASAILPATAANAQAVITSVTPNSGPAAGGTTVTITGTDFTGATAVQFDGTAATSYTVDSNTQITAVTPAHAAGLVSVGVFTPGGSGFLNNGFTYLPPAPTITSVSPTSGTTAGAPPLSSLAPTLPARLRPHLVARRQSATRSTAQRRSPQFRLRGRQAWSISQ